LQALQRVTDRLAKQNIHLLATDDTTRHLAAPAFGARPVKQTIQKHLLDPLSLAFLDGSFKYGDHTPATLKIGKVEFEKRWLDPARGYASGSIFSNRLHPAPITCRTQEQFFAILSKY